MIATKTEKTKLDLVKEAQVELQDAINDKRIELIELMTEFEAIGGADDVPSAVRKFAGHIDGGVPYRFLQGIFPDAELTKARKELKASGQVQETGKKGEFRIKLAETK